MSALSRTLLLALIGVAALPAGAQQQQDNLTKAQVAEKIGAKPEELRQSPIPGMYEYARGADDCLCLDRWQIRQSTVTSTRWAPIAISSEATRRVERAKLIADVPEVADAGVCAEGSQVHRLRVHRRGLRLLPAAPQPDGGVQPPRHQGAISVLSALGSAHRVVGEGGRGVVLGRSRQGAHARQPWRVAAHAEAVRDADRASVRAGQGPGVRGTPAIVLPNGEMLPGYLPPQALAMRLRTVRRQRDS